MSLLREVEKSSYAIMTLLRAASDEKLLEI